MRAPYDGDLTAGPPRRFSHPLCFVRVYPVLRRGQSNEYVFTDRDVSFRRLDEIFRGWDTYIRRDAVYSTLILNDDRHHRLTFPSPSPRPRRFINNSLTPAC